VFLSKAKYGFSGIAIGAIALSLAIFSFWSDPFPSSLTAEPTLKEKVISLKETTIDTIQGKPAKKTPILQRLDINKIVIIAISTLSIIAILLGVFSYINKEPIRVAISSVAIAVSAILFQLIATYIIIVCALLVVIAIVGSFAA